MNLLKRISLAFAVTTFLAAGTSVQAATFTPIVLDGGSRTDFPNTLPLGSAIPVIVGANAGFSPNVNAGGARTGFSGFFTSSYGLLGASTDGSAINGTGQAEAGISTLTSRQFTFGTLSQPVNLSFQFAFNGNATGLSSDIFTVFFTNLETNQRLQVLSVQGGVLSALAGATFTGNTTSAGLGFQALLNPFDVSTLAFFNTINSYTFSCSLSEATANGNTAAGCDTISLISPFVTTVPEPTTMTGFLALGGFGAFSRLQKRRLNKQSI
ncbi:PEP-CTERM sorting domain-containing protein [Anthocerotibacter panamensis]|uniref:PEP-CTERM sorting domain-containing protein n=1 Tax=Anthocerotibacter panamensis TaxID=2857077 RepID=UPI001C4050DD|nr:PEP-CTERM sorting domain-containing protein [Anthocerotibacter panamensis]